ncbi:MULTISPECIES: alpha/beta hydrolase [unclassified Beijerinckia]|uniref:alpha/beta fold hydrolase n=1 Tax=unclassified Beijerinckia TaxID=2638183 RepID=UPI00089D1811|nr:MULTISPECIES: alpha/beta hydrolase [unclassified Beijerinckia]MDH7798975.1 pimeloyl-ACP methyl ester carboxylesterase [Beijerinckia sp. GAS462]SED85450.1 Pimeloyl-ACP methyl ester carboxylesterase [Beijerinckia sp. 28-YEA-48]
MSLRYTPSGMAYWEEGQGPPLVLLHGALSDYRVWSPQIDELAQRYRTIAVSLRGYVPTQDQMAGATAQRHADDLVAFLHDELSEPVTLIGHSRGGRIALDVATRVAVEKLVLFEPGGIVEPDFYKQTIAEATPINPSDVRPIVRALVASGSREKALKLYIDHGHGAGAWQRLPEWYRAVLVDNAPTIDMMIADATIKLSRRTCANITCPIHLIGGRASPPGFARVMDVIQDCNSLARRVIVPGDHFSNVCEPAGFNVALQACLR